MTLSSSAIRWLIFGVLIVSVIILCVVLCCLFGSNNNSICCDNSCAIEGFKRKPDRVKNAIKTVGKNNEEKKKKPEIKLSDEDSFLKSYIETSF